jgi:hypothetical protein
MDWHMPTDYVLVLVHGLNTAYELLGLEADSRKAPPVFTEGRYVGIMQKV